MDSLGIQELIEVGEKNQTETKINKQVPTYCNYNKATYTVCVFSGARGESTILTMEEKST